MTTNSTMATFLTLVVLTGTLVAPVAAATAQETTEMPTTTETPRANSTTTETQTATPTTEPTTSPNESASTPTATPVPTPTPTATPEPTPTASTEAATHTDSSALPTSASECDFEEGDRMLSHKRLYAPETSIETGAPGQIAGGFQAAPTADCPIVVRITMEVPSGMEVSGASDVLSGGAGMVSGSFVVHDGGIEDIRATVYGTTTGDHTVTADIEYWPQGHEELSHRIDGLRFTFDVESPSETHPGNATAESAAPDLTDRVADAPFGWAVTAGLGALTFAAIVVGRRRG